MKFKYFCQAIVYSCFLFIFMASCSVIGINIRHSTPKNAYKLPKFSEKDSLRGTLNKYRSCFDVYYYRLNVDFDVKNKEISGKVNIHFSALSDFDTIQLDLYKNMILDSVVHGSEQLKFKRKHDAIFVHFNNSIKKSENVTISVYYHGNPQIAKRPPWEGGFVWSKDKNKKPWIGVACEVYGASLWWPVKDHLSDEPDSMSLCFTVPKGLMCVSNGKLADSIVKNDKTSYTWKVSSPINTYNATFYIGDFKHFAIPYQGIDTNFVMDFYVLPYNLEKARNQFKQATDIIRVFEKYFGPYPWPRDGYKLVESPFAGMEHQSAIAYGNGYKNNYNLVDYIILHETAHEWWGNSVTVPDYAEVWIHEGFATYSEALYMEELKGHEEYLRYLNIYAMFIKNQRPVVGPHDVNFWEYKDTDVYMKGALLLHTLRNSIGNDSIFFDIIKTFYTQHQYGFAVSHDFIGLVNEKTQKDFAPFFNQYLYNRESPKLEWEYYQDAKADTNVLVYRWKNAVDGFTMPIKVKTGNRIFQIRPTNKLQKSYFPKEKNIIMNISGSYIESSRTDVFK